jgi:large subunit ribosomal protein L6
MSRIGKKPIVVPAGVKISIVKSDFSAEGPKGKLSFRLPGKITVESKDNQLFVQSPLKNSIDKSLHGLSRSLVANIIKGVTEGFVKELEVHGVGFRVSVQNNFLVLILGFSHPVNFPIPEDIKIETPKPSLILVKGQDKQRVGEIAAQIRRFFPPEPYKGKGIRYVGEHVRRKQGKAATK